MAKTGTQGAGLAYMFTTSSYLCNEIEQRRDMLYALAFSWCHDPVLADDLVQETMLKALRNARQLKDNNAIKSWLGRILANNWYDHLRKSRETVDLDSLHYEDYDNHSDTNDRQEIIEKVRKCITQLPIGQRQVITLVDLAGFSYTEIAETLDIPIGTVMSRICRARKVLKLALAEYDPRPESAHVRLTRVK